MTIEEIRQQSLEYAKGHVKTGPSFRTRRVNTAKERRRAALDEFKVSIGMAVEIPVQTDAYKHQDAGDDGKAPW